MNDAWFKVIDFLQQNFWWGVGLSVGGFFLLIVLLVIIPSGKKKKKPSQALPANEPSEEELPPISDTSDPEEMKERLNEYKATLSSKEREIVDKTEQLEALEALIDDRSAELNLLEDIPEELEGRITTNRKSVHTRYFWVGLLVGVAVATAAFGIYYYIWVIKGGSI